MAYHTVIASVMATDMVIIFFGVGCHIWGRFQQIHPDDAPSIYLWIAIFNVWCIDQSNGSTLIPTISAILKYTFQSSFYFISFSNTFLILVHDYSLCLIRSPCCSVSYYNYISIWPYYICIHLMFFWEKWIEIVRFFRTMLYCNVWESFIIGSANVVTVGRCPNRFRDQRNTAWCHPPVDYELSLLMFGAKLNISTLISTISIKFMRNRKF